MYIVPVVMSEIAGNYIRSLLVYYSVENCICNSVDDFSWILEVVGQFKDSGIYSVVILAIFNECMNWMFELPSKILILRIV